MVDESVLYFFEQSDSLDRMVTRQLDHIKGNWELMWDKENKKYLPEEDSFAELLNELIIYLCTIESPKSYHKYEDEFAEICKKENRWNIKKIKNRWVGADYPSILEQGSFDDINTENLCLAARGRISEAIKRGQIQFDMMEFGHKVMLGDLLAVILYHRNSIIR